LRCGKQEYVIDYSGVVCIFLFLAYVFMISPYATSALQSTTPKEDDEINHLGWTDGRRYTAYGLHFGLRCNDPTVLELAAPYLPHGWQPTPLNSPKSDGIETDNNEVDILYSLYFATSSAEDEGSLNDPVEGARPAIEDRVEGSHLLYCGANLLIRTQELPRLLATLEQHSQLLTAFRAKDYLFVHAGVVGWQGRAILIPGRSMSGKSTLVRALLDAGATYYSDEFAVLNGEGRVHPYPLPISIRQGDNIVGTKTPLEALGIQPGDKPLTVALVVVTKYKRYARWQPEILTPSQAMLALMDNTVAARREPTFSMPILKKVATAAKTVSSKRGEAKRVVPAILKELNLDTGESTSDWCYTT